VASRMPSALLVPGRAAGEVRATRNDDVGTSAGEAAEGAAARLSQAGSPQFGRGESPANNANSVQLFPCKSSHFGALARPQGPL
jgi:hypothetical protein